MLRVSVQSHNRACSAGQKLQDAGTISFDYGFLDARGVLPAAHETLHAAELIDAQIASRHCKRKTTHAERLVPALRIGVFFPGKSPAILTGRQRDHPEGLATAARLHPRTLRHLERRIPWLPISSRSSWSS
jgi:hypothetical protein